MKAVPETKVIRCAWATNDLAILYHDREWGVPQHDDRVLFEFLVLEGAQAGLSWDTILKKRENYRAAFDFHELDSATKAFVPITDEERILTIGRSISPVNHVSPDDPPTLIIHGDADKLVPIQQAEIIIAKLKEVGVPAELVVKKGAVHGWKGMDKDLATFVDWFDRHLKKPAQTNQ